MTLPLGHCRDLPASWEYSVSLEGSYRDNIQIFKGYQKGFIGELLSSGNKHSILPHTAFQRFFYSQGHAISRINWKIS